MIVSMTGHADNFSLVFTQCNDGRWAVTVPPDLSDGMYVCDVRAVDHMGTTIYWTGILYMADGACVCLKLIEEDIFENCLLDDDMKIVLDSERTEIVLLEKRCC